MQTRLENILKLNDTVAVAVSGGCDSMCLLHFLLQNASKIGYKVLALNVEHGIRGEDSVSDTNFVKDYCSKNDIPLLTYSVDAPKYAKDNKLSLEQAARTLRYDCFKQALDSGKCNKVATAHHRDDNVETILFNLFRGTGLKGLTGITREREDGVIRPFLSVDRSEIEEYAKTHRIPYVTDKTNLLDDYTRNDIRHNVVPEIKRIFPELNKSVERLTSIVNADQDFINQTAINHVNFDGETAYIPIPCHPAVLSRAVIIALKKLGVKKDWEKAHIDQVLVLAELENGAKISLLNGITAIKEYDKIVFYFEDLVAVTPTAFKLGKIQIANKAITITQEQAPVDLKKGFYADLEKVPKTTVIRTRADGDVFTKFGGGTKLLNDYFTDKKIPLRERNKTLILADGKTVLAIFGLAISEKIKVDPTTKKMISLKID